MGAMASLISTGVLRTPEGKAVADSPSAAGRAPVPPLWNRLTVKGVAFSKRPATPCPP